MTEWAVEESWSDRAVRVEAIRLVLERERGNIVKEGQILKDAKEYEKFILGKKGDGDGE